MMGVTHVARQLSATRGRVWTTPASVHLGTRQMDGVAWVRAILCSRVESSGTMTVYKRQVSIFLMISIDP